MTERNWRDYYEGLTNAEWGVIKAAEVLNDAFEALKLSGVPIRRNDTKWLFNEVIDVCIAVDAYQALTKKSATEVPFLHDAGIPSEPDAVSVAEEAATSSSVDSAVTDAELGDSTASDVRFKVGDRVRVKDDSIVFITQERFGVVTKWGISNKGEIRFIELDDSKGNWAIYVSDLELVTDDDYIKLDASPSSSYNIGDIVRAKATKKLFEVSDVASAGVIVDTCNSKAYHAFSDIEFVK